MKALLFDPLSGASGSMILGSLIDLGADIEKIRSTIELVANAAISVKRPPGGGVTTAKVNVISFQEKTAQNYHGVIKIIRGSGLPEVIGKDVLSVFDIMANAEARIRGKTPDQMTSFETWQDDVLPIVIGSCTALRDLQVETVFATPVNIGRDASPATLEILRKGGLLFYGRGDRELLTPTGAALLSHFSQPVDNIPPGRALAIGYGAKSAGKTPDILRTLLMEIRDEIPEDLIEVLETNVDNISGEILGNLFDRLMALGARDVTISPVTMKKGRPGHIIRVVSLPHTSETLAEAIMRETGTLGIRVMTGRHRFTAARSMDSVTLSIGDKCFETPVKIASDKTGKIFHISAEYEACKKIANAADLPLREVIRRVEEEGWKRFGKPSL